MSINTGMTTVNNMPGLANHQPQLLKNQLSSPMNFENSRNKLPPLQIDKSYAMAAALSAQNAALPPRSGTHFSFPEE